MVVVVVDEASTIKISMVVAAVEEVVAGVEGVAVDVGSTTKTCTGVVDVDKSARREILMILHLPASVGTLKRCRSPRLLVPHAAVT